MYRNNENVYVHFCDSQELNYVSIHPTSYPTYDTLYTVVPTLDAHVSGGTPLSIINVFLHFEYLLGVCITYDCLISEKQS